MSNDNVGSPDSSGENLQNQMGAVKRLIEVAIVQDVITGEQGGVVLQLVELYANMLANGQVEIGENSIANVGILNSWRGGNPDPYREPQALAVLPMRLLPEIRYSEQVQGILMRLGEPPIRLLMYAGVGDDGVVDRAAVLVTYTSPTSPADAVASQDELYALVSEYHPFAHFPTHSTGIVFNRDPDGFKFRFSHTMPVKQNTPTHAQVKPGVFRGSAGNMATLAPKHDGIIAWEALFSGGVMLLSN